MTQFLTPDCPLPPYLAFPRFLLDKTNLNETAKILYTILLDRARLSQKNDGWTDEQSHVFIFYPIKKLAETMHKSEMSIKTALTALETEELIVRYPNRIYVKVPPEYLIQTDRILSPGQTEFCPADGKKSVPVTDRKLSGSNKEKSNIKKANSGSKERSAFGIYQNVFLSTGELTALQREFPRYYQEYMEKLSGYMASSGRLYASHAATIRSWIMRDHPAPAKRSYECKEGESL